MVGPREEDDEGGSPGMRTTRVVAQRRRVGPPIEAHPTS
jgi:hypothetical protein